MRLSKLRGLSSASLPVFLGVAVALGGCSEGSTPSLQPIKYDATDELYIQPIRVCDDNGNACARINFFEDITARILAQARIRISFLPVNQLNSTRFLSIGDQNSGSASSEFYELTRTGGAGAFCRHPNSTNSSGPINLWFVDEIKAGNGAVQFGMAWVGANGVLISEAVLDYNHGMGRMDTIAHEIGHNLGLRHSTLGAGAANNLLTDGNGRQTPRSAADVGPHGGGIDLLTDAQIETISASSFLSRNSFVQAGCTATSPDEGAALLTSLSASAFSSSLNTSTPTTFAMDAARRSFAPASAAAKVPEPTIGWISLSAISLFLLGFNRRALSCRL